MQDYEKGSLKMINLVNYIKRSKRDLDTQINCE